MSQSVAPARQGVKAHHSLTSVGELLTADVAGSSARRSSQSPESQKLRQAGVRPAAPKTAGPRLRRRQDRGLLFHIGVRGTDRLDERLCVGRVEELP